MIVLSIDPGEKVIGYTITSKNTVLRWGHIKRSKCTKRSKTQDFVDNKIENILLQNNVEKVLIEIHTSSKNKFREDEKEIVSCIEKLNIPIMYYTANEYLQYFNLIGYDKSKDNLFNERQREVFKKFKVKTKSRHNIDCLLMAIYDQSNLETNLAF